jgi:DNA processing protein
MKAPTQYSTTVQLLALTRFADVGPRLFDLLMCYYASPSELLSAAPEAIRAVPGVVPGAVEKIAKAAASLELASQYSEELLQRDIGIATRFDPDYGTLLQELNDPPVLLYYRGAMPDPSKKSVTLMGARNPSAEGIAWSTSLARKFAEHGIQIISSLDVGADSAAHLGSRSASGRTFAVLEGGFDQLDASTQVPLAIDVGRNGGVISEYAPDIAIAPENGREANRLIAALGQAVVVTEIYHDSEKLWDLLEFCGQIGKLAMVTIDPVHGPLADRESLNHALQNGAVILQGPDQAGDIIRSLV